MLNCLLEDIIFFGAIRLSIYLDFGKRKKNNLLIHKHTERINTHITENDVFFF